MEPKNILGPRYEMGFFSKGTWIWKKKLKF